MNRPFARRSARLETSVLADETRCLGTKASGRDSKATTFVCSNLGGSQEWPNKRVQSTPLRVERDRRYFMCYHMLKAFPISDCGAADAQVVRP